MGDKKVIYVLCIDIWVQEGIMFKEKTFDSLPQITIDVPLSYFQHSHCKHCK